MPLVPSYIENLENYVPGKPIEEVQRNLGLNQIDKLASNENPIGPSPKALLEIEQSIKKLHRYPDASGYELRTKLSKQFKVKNENYVEQTHFAKTAFFKNPTDYDEKYHIEEYNKHLDNFIETTRFQNIFNRMIMYDPNEFHRANSYYVGSEDESRLTLVYFIGGIEAGRTPLNRIKYEEYDSFIDYRIKHESEEK